MEEVVKNSSSDADGEIFLTSKEAARFLRVSTNTLSTYRRKIGRIQLSKRKILYRKSDLIDYLGRSSVKPQGKKASVVN